MVAGAFPVIKFGSLALRQISKPLVNGFKRYAKNSNVFRNYVCMPIAQTYHSLETTFKMYLLGLGKPKSVAPLNEQMAVDLGAEILGEVLTFSVAAATVAWEVNRSAESSKRKEEEAEDRLQRLEARVDFLTIENERQSAQLREVLHTSAWLSSPFGKAKARKDGRSLSSTSTGRRLTLERPRPKERMDRRAGTLGPGEEKDSRARGGGKSRIREGLLTRALSDSLSPLIGTSGPSPSSPGPSRGSGDEIPSSTSTSSSPPSSPSPSPPPSPSNGEAVTEFMEEMLDWLEDEVLDLD